MRSAGTDEKALMNVIGTKPIVCLRKLCETRHYNLQCQDKTLGVVLKV